MGFLRKRSFLIGAAFYAIVSLAIILFASPLFRVLGFEYSGFIAIFCSIHLLYYSSNRIANNKDVNIFTILHSLFIPVFLFISIPLLISVISSLFIPNCSLFDGFLFYIKIVIPTALIALLCGVCFGSLQFTKRKRNLYL